MASYLLLCCALCVLGVSSEFTPVCNTADFVLEDGHPSLPTQFIPDQYFYTVRADIVEWNASYYFSEYFDGPGNRGRIDSDIFGEDQVTVIADYDLDEAFTLSLTGCTVSRLHTPPSPNAFSPSFIFGLVEGANETLSVGSPSTFLFFNNESARYLGDNYTVRGVPCQRWQTCTVSDTNDTKSSYVIDYYFGDPSSGWSLSDSDAPAPVLVVLKGEDYNVSTGDVQEQEHYYSYMPFQVGPSAVPDYVFQIPIGTACTGRIPGPDLPPFPPYFSATMEYVDATISSTAKMYYDYQYQLFRVDYLDSTGPFAVIQDFNIEVVYLISKDYQNCSVYPLEYSDDFAFEATVNSSSGDVQLLTAQQILLASNEFEYSYEGTTNIRGAEVDSWISLRDFEQVSPSMNFTNVIYQIFFTRPDYVVNSDTSTTTEPAIWQLRLQAVVQYIDSISGEVNSTNITADYNFIGFSPNEPPLDVFDSSLCLDPSEFVVLNFAIVTNSTPRITSIRPAVRNALLKYAQEIQMPFLTALQISAIQVFYGQGSYNVSTHISNLTNETSFVWAYTANSVVDAITNDLDPGDRLPFNITIAGTYYPTQFLSVGALNPCEDCPSSPSIVTPTSSPCAVVTPACSPCEDCPSSPSIGEVVATPTNSPCAVEAPTCSPCEDSPSSLSVGEIVGLSFAMFIAGWIFAVIFGIILYVLWDRRKKTKDANPSFIATAVSYAKHVNEDDTDERIENLAD